MRAFLAVPRLAVLTILLAACSEPPTAVDPVDGPSAAVVANVRTPFGPFLSFNNCTGEFLEFNGTRHDLFSVTADGNGGFHVTSHRNWQNLSAVGVVSGTNYRAQQILNSSENVRPPFPVTLILHTSLRFIAKGSNDEFRLKGHFRTLINGNGEVVLDEFNPAILECR